LFTIVLFFIHRLLRRTIYRSVLASSLYPSPIIAIRQQAEKQEKYVAAIQSQTSFLYSPLFETLID
jgi:hypothetical protein